MRRWLKLISRLPCLPSPLSFSLSFSFSAELVHLSLRNSYTMTRMWLKVASLSSTKNFPCSCSLSNTLLDWLTWLNRLWSTCSCRKTTQYGFLVGCCYVFERTVSLAFLANSSYNSLFYMILLTMESKLVSRMASLLVLILALQSGQFLLLKVCLSKHSEQNRCPQS